MSAKTPRTAFDIPYVMIIDGDAYDLVDDLTGPGAPLHDASRVEEQQARIGIREAGASQPRGPIERLPVVEGVRHVSEDPVTGAWIEPVHMGIPGGASWNPPPPSWYAKGKIDE